MTFDAGRIRHDDGLMHYARQSNGSAVPSNWIRSTDGTTAATWRPESASSVSYGSNSNDVSFTDAAGAANLSSRADHVHRGVTSLAHASNTYTGPVTLETEGSLYIVRSAANTYRLGSTGTSGGGGGSGTLTTVEEVDGSPTDSAVTKLVFPNGTLAITSHVATYTPTSSSSGGQLLPFDVPPGSAHAKDDEFPGSSLDAKWTNPISSGAGLTITATVANNWLSFEPATSGTSSTGKRLFGIRQSSPTGSFTISAKIGTGDNRSNDVVHGIFVARTADTTFDSIGRYANGNIALYRAIGSTGYSETADTGSFAWVADAGQQPGGHVWYKIVWASGGSTLTFYYSTDGVTWWQATQRTSRSQPDRIGLMLYANGASVAADSVLAANWFRVTEP